MLKHRPRVIWLQDELDAKFGKGSTRVICPITDAFVAHHGALGGFVRVYCNAKATPEAVRAYAASLDEVELPGGETRPREWTDKFPARSGEGMGPDLSLMAKARAGFHGPAGTGISQFVNGIGGPEYIYSILTMYNGEEKEEAGSFFYGNDTFPGGWIAMNPPLSDGQVEYADGHDNSAHHMAEDVSAFLMWAAEPKMMDRKNSGFIAVIFLGVLSTLLYLTNKRLWAGVKGKKKHA